MAWFSAGYSWIRVVFRTRRARTAIWWTDRKIWFIQWICRYLDMIDNSYFYGILSLLIGNLTCKAMSIHVNTSYRHIFTVFHLNGFFFQSLQHFISSITSTTFKYNDIHNCDNENDYIAQNSLSIMSYMIHVSQKYITYIMSITGRIIVCTYLILPVSLSICCCWHSFNMTPEFPGFLKKKKFQGMVPHVNFLLTAYIIL